MTKEREEEIIDLYLPFLLVCFLVQQYNDSLENTSIFRQRVKHLSKEIGKEIEKIIKEDLNELLGIDDKTAYKMMDVQKDVITKLSTLKIEQWGDMNTMLDEYIKENKKLEIRVISNWQKRCEMAENYIELIGRSFKLDNSKEYKEWQKLKNNEYENNA